MIPDRRSKTPGSGRGGDAVPRGCSGGYLAAIASMRTLVLASIIITAALPVHADDGLRSGFVVHAGGELRGIVTGITGDPARDLEVHAASASGEQVVKTDHDGRFRITLRDGSTYVYVHGTAHVAGTMAVSTKEGGQEVIELHDMIPPAAMPVPKSSTRAIPQYSRKAIDADVWTRAWLVLDVAETGAVTRVKLVDDPGYDLGPIAVRAAFALQFEPARDRSNHPVRAWMMWAYEWPSYSWMRDLDASLVRLPTEVDSIPCRGSGPTHTVYRDCTPPDMVKAVARPWIGGTPTK